MSPVLFKALMEKESFVRDDPYKSDVFSLGYCMLIAAVLDFNFINTYIHTNAINITNITPNIIINMLAIWLFVIFSFLLFIYIYFVLVFLKF